jgi:parallel beta-helix repeat protein
LGYYGVVVNLSKTVSTLFLVLCLYSAIILKNNQVIVNASPSTLIVPDDGYKTIQEAINNASSGDIIFVRNGMYAENIVINKSITLIGEGRESTIIDGKATGNVISIKASNVTISGFTIKNSDPFKGCGILIERSGNIIIGNNNIINNYAGIQITLSGGNQIYENMISANYVGIELSYSSDNVIYRNAITDNFDGIDFYYSIGSIICENILSNNDWRSIYISFSSDNNVFYRNNFGNNLYNVYAEQQTTNIWNYSCEGNYWDDYRGEDSNKDGIGDTPHNIDEKNVDYYPLMGRYHTFAVPFKKEIYRVAIVSNSTIISNFTFKVAAESRTRVILFNATGINDSAGFSRVVIPKALMENIHEVLVNEEEVNATLLNVTDVKNSYLYIEYSGNCSIKIVYLELLDLYYQLLADYSELLNKLHGLNATTSALMKELNSLNETFHNLLKNYSNLQNELDNLNSVLTALNKTFHNFLNDYSDFLKDFSNMSESYRNEAQNFKSLTYVFAAVAAIFIMMTIYLSKVAHTKQGRIVES